MPNANMCSRRPLVPSEKFLPTKISLSDSDQTPKSTCSHEHTALISIELTAKNLRPESELKLTNDVLEARHTDMKQKPVIIVLSPFIEATDSKCNHHHRHVGIRYDSLPHPASFECSIRSLWVQKAEADIDHHMGNTNTPSARHQAIRSLRQQHCQGVSTTY